MTAPEIRPCRRRISGRFADDASTAAAPPAHSFFLFGARGTGKTTWIEQHFRHAAAQLRPAACQRGYRLPYWKSHDGAEVDFVIELPDRLVAIECKAAQRWDSRFHSGIRRFRDLAGKRPVEGIGVYAGPRAQRFDDVRVLPWRLFLQHLWHDRLLA